MTIDKIRFPFDREKALAAAAFLVELEGGAVDIIRLTKLLYLAERESLQDHGWPLIGGDYLSRKHGPVCESAYRLAADGLDLWREHFARRGHQVLVVNEPARDVLSEADLEVLRRVWARVQDVDDWELVVLTHNLDEWKGYDHLDAPIWPEEILRAVGRSDDEIRATAELAEEAWHMRTILP